VVHNILQGYDSVPTKTRHKPQSEKNVFNWEILTSVSLTDWLAYAADIK
jgi:hypothetical protein